MLKKIFRSDKSGSRVFVFIATKPYFRNEAKKAIVQLRKVMPQCIIRVFSDEPSDFTHDVILHKIEEPHNSFRDKVDSLNRIEDDRVVFLDTDIYVGRPIDNLFDILDDYDFAMAQASARMNTEQCFPDFNSGVLAFRNNDKVRKILKEWKDLLFQEKNGYPDQPILSKLIYKNKSKILNLPTEMNLRGGQYSTLSGDISVLHLHWENRFGFDNHKLYEFLSRSRENRLFIPNEKKMIDDKGNVFVYE